MSLSKVFFHIVNRDGYMGQTNQKGADITFKRRKKVISFWRNLFSEFVLVSDLGLCEN